MFYHAFGLIYLYKTFTSLIGIPIVIIHLFNYLFIFHWYGGRRIKHNNNSEDINICH